MSRRGTNRGNPAAAGDAPGLRVQLLGPFAVWRDGRPLPLPASRKLRALFAYLALSPRPSGRSQLCELLWDGPSDPRAELRWCLSRIRSVIDEPQRPRLVAAGDTIALDLDDCVVDAIDVLQAADGGFTTIDPDRQQALLELFRGDLLEGIELDDSPVFGQWLAAQRRRLRACHAALLEHLSTHLPADRAVGHLENWLQLVPFDRRVHERLLALLARSGRFAEGDEHVAATAALFESEGLDATPIRDAWRSARLHGERAPAVQPGGEPSPAEAAGTSRRASIAVMPFADESVAPRVRGGPADALAHDITTRLARLRSLFVIAQGSTFALHERRIGPEEAGRMLDVDYVVRGAVRIQAARLRVSVELVEARTAHIVWSETLHDDVDDTLFVLDEIGNRIVASIAGEIEAVERNRAMLRPPSTLDAWEAHHRGLWHMYRFTKDDNARARHFFEMAVRLDPTFSRAHAGLSFTHFQNAFQGWAPRAAEIDRAFASAGQGLMADERDPAAHWAVGRALWLRGNTDQAVGELRRSIELSPNFALGHYALAFVQSQSGDADAAIAMSDCSRELSPFDPLLFGMLGARAMALARLGRYDEAAAWAVKAAAQPNAHVHIQAIAALTLALAGQQEQARGYAAAVRRIQSGYGLADFLDAFRFGDDAVALFRRGARDVGLT